MFQRRHTIHCPHRYSVAICFFTLRYNLMDMNVALDRRKEFPHEFHKSASLLAPSFLPRLHFPICLTVARTDFDGRPVINPVTSGTNTRSPSPPCQHGEPRERKLPPHSGSPLHASLHFVNCFPFIVSCAFPTK